MTKLPSSVFHILMEPSALPLAKYPFGNTANELTESFVFIDLIMLLTTVVVSIEVGEIELVVLVVVLGVVLTEVVVSNGVLLVALVDEGVLIVVVDEVDET